MASDGNRDADQLPPDESFRERIRKKIDAYDPRTGAVNLAGCGIDESSIYWVVREVRLLGDIAQLDVSKNQLGAAGALAIAKNFPTLTTLFISSNEIGEAGAIAIGDHLTALETLDISFNRIGEAGAIAVAEHLTALTALCISNNSIGDGGVVAIAEHLTALDTLDIGCNLFYEAGVVAIAKNLRALTALFISDSEIGDAGAVAIAEHLTAVETLDLSDNSIGDMGAIAVAEHLTALTVLDISFNRIGEAGGIAIAKRLTALTTLHVKHTDIGEAGAIAIAENLTALTTLYIHSNHIGDPGVVAIAEHLTALETLGISHNNIGDAGAVAIAEHLTALKTLELSDNNIGDAGAVAIAEHLTALKTLEISDNNIGDAGVVVALLQRRVGPNGPTNLKSLSVSGNPLGWPGTEALISEETLKQKDPAKLLTLLMASRPAIGEDLMAARATMAGLGMSGKTRLTRWLVNHPKRKDPIETHDRTIGVDPLETRLLGNKFAYPDLGEIMLTVLDCGGQHEQLQSHHNLVYKAAGRSLFILCLHAGKEFHSRDGNRADYYLRMLQSYRGDASRQLPVLIVVTHGELTGTPARKLNVPKDLRDRYPLLHITTIDPYLGDVGKEIEHVRSAIADFLVNMPEIRAKLPKGTLKLRDAMRRRFQLDEPLPPDPREVRIDQPSLSPREFSEVCIENGIMDESLHGDYLRHMASLGVAIAPGVERTISADVKRLDSVVAEVFNPRYVNQYVYGLLMNQRVRRNDGFMTESEFREETTRLTEAQRGELRKVLKRYLVVFEWKNEDEEGLLIPDLLPERESPATWHDQLCSATLHFRGIFLGEPRFFEFLSTHKELIVPLALTEAEALMPIRPIGVFRNEVCVRNGPCEALVQIDVVESRIDVSVRGGTIEEACRWREQIIGQLSISRDTSLSEPREGDAVVVQRSERQPPNQSSAGSAQENQIAVEDVRLRLVVSERRVYVNEMNVGTVTPLAVRVLRKMMKNPRYRFKYDELLNRPDAVKTKKEYQDYVKDVVDSLPALVRALLDPGRGGYHGGRCFKENVRTEIRR